MIKKTIKHIVLVMRHKWYVFIFCCKLGMPYRGFMHDWSKFSPTEFFESIRYYKGTYSPITECKRQNGYSKAWLHHKGRNKHHPEYWYDEHATDQTPMIPYKYVAEMICDKLSASKIYNGKKWTLSSELEYWEKEKLKTYLNDNIKEMLTAVFTQVAEQGINKTLKRKNIKKFYKEYCVEKINNKK